MFVKVSLLISHSFWKCLHPHGNNENNPKGCSNFVKSVCDAVPLPTKRNKNKNNKVEGMCTHTLDTGCEMLTQKDTLES